jgi:hypothetical protein
MTPETRGLISTSWRGTIAPVATVFSMMSVMTGASVSKTCGRSRCFIHSE